VRFFCVRTFVAKIRFHLRAYRRYGKKKIAEAANPLRDGEIKRSRPKKGRLTELISMLASTKTFALCSARIRFPHQLSNRTASEHTLTCDLIIGCRVGSANLNARYFRIRFDQTIQLLELEDKSAQRVCVDIHSSINRLRATERAERREA